MEDEREEGESWRLEDKACSSFDCIPVRININCSIMTIALKLRGIFSTDRLAVVAGGVMS